MSDINTNAVADEVAKYLETKHARVYRNRAIRSPIFPYVVFRVESVLNTSPSEDFYINVDVYEDVSESVRAIEELADSIDSGLNMKVVNTSELNMHFIREQRQYVDDEELVGKQMINLRYNTRIYFKGEI